MIGGLVRRAGAARVAAVTGALASVGPVALLMLSPVANQVAIPGPLRSSHGFLRDRCEACHPASIDAVHGLHRGLAVTDLDRAQSQLCLACHELGDHAAGAPVAGADAMACSRCHTEHRGVDAAVSQVGSQGCQSCHAEPFEAFDDGHPELGSYPYRERAAIHFDHRSHLDRHFAEAADAPRDCSACHVLDADGRDMGLVSYERACASCHEGEVRGIGRVDGPGLAVLGLPAIDLMSLEESGIEIGDWPADAAFSDAALTPFLELLLETDPELEDALATWRRLDPLDLYDASDEERRAVGRVGRAIKELFGDLAGGGHEALRARLGGDGSLVGQLPAAVLRAALDTWLPRLDEELTAADLEPGSVDDLADLDGDPHREGWMAAGGWYRRDVDTAILYRSRGHADPFLRAWIDHSGAVDGPAASALFETLTSEEAVGRCTKCHAVDDATGEVSWSSPAGPRAPLARFSHAPHVLAVEGRDCSACHERATDGPAGPAGFRPMTIASCVECHTSGGVSTACRTCHDYHAGGHPR